ncbi:MAG: hypothetical protein RL498_388 [Pseudomonadota bacterium]|jgi:hypothetical protein
MNLHKYETEVRNLLVEGRRNSSGKNPNLTRRTNFPGVYVISRNMTNKGLMKLGEAHGQGGIIDRINGQYKICMPLKSDEFYLRYIVITPRKQEGKKHYSQIMESRLLDAISISMGVTDSYSKEYLFQNSDIKLEDKMFEVFKVSKQYFKIAVKFTTSGFYIYEEDKGFKTPIQDFSSIPTFNEEISAMLELRKGKQMPSPENILTSMKNSQTTQAIVVNPTQAIVVNNSSKPKRITKVPAKFKDNAPKAKAKSAGKSDWWGFFEQYKAKNSNVPHTKALKKAGVLWEKEKLRRAT